MKSFNSVQNPNCFTKVIILCFLTNCNGHQIGEEVPSFWQVLKKKAVILIKSIESFIYSPTDLPTEQSIDWSWLILHLGCRHWLLSYILPMDEATIELTLNLYARTTVRGPSNDGPRCYYFHSRWPAVCLTSLQRSAIWLGIESATHLIFQSFGEPHWYKSYQHFMRPIFFFRIK